MDYLAEHDSPTREKEINDNATGEPDISPEEKQTAKLVEYLLTKAKKAREPYDRMFIDRYRFFRGDQWKKKRASHFHSEVFNFIWQAIQATVPIMTDVRPKAAFSPTDPSDLEFAQVLTELYDADWQKGNWLYKTSEALFDGHIYGTGFMSLFPEFDHAVGDVRMHVGSTDPIAVYPDPDALDCNDNCDYMLVCEAEDVDKVKERYKNHKYRRWIKSDMADLTKKVPTVADRIVYPRNTDTNLPRFYYGSDAEQLSDKVLVITAHVKSSECIEEKIEKENPDGTVSDAYLVKKKYPKGRRIVKINNLIFEDESFDNDALKIPLVRYVNYVDPRKFWGISEIEQLESPQVILNKILSFVLDVLNLTGNPVWLIPTDSMVTPGSFTNAPGSQIPHTPGSPPIRVEGSQLQPYVLQLVDRLVNWFNGISGSQDVTRGIAPASITANSAIENLMDAAQTRIREKMRHLDGMQVQLGQMYVDYVLKYYTAPRIFRYTNKDGMDKYFKFHVEQIFDEAGNPVFDDKGDPSRKGVVRNFRENEFGAIVPEDTVKEYLIRGSFDVRVNTESGLPFSKSEKETRLITFLREGVIDREEVLKQSDYPNWEAVLKRMEEKEAAAAQQQAQQQGAI